MTSLKDKALAALRWVGEALAALVRAGWAALVKLGQTVYDPPPKTIRFWFFSLLALALAGAGTYAFVNSWFYTPTIATLSSLFHEEAEYPEPEVIMAAPPPVALPALPPGTALDMSDTPQRVPFVVTKTVEEKPIRKVKRKRKVKPVLTPARDDLRLF